MHNAEQLTLSPIIEHIEKGTAPPIVITNKPYMKKKECFDYNKALCEVMCDIIQSIPELRHIDPKGIYLGSSWARNNRASGVQAKVAALRFENGHRYKKKGQWEWYWPTVYYKNNPLLYIITVYLPRFQNLHFKKKIETIIHELYHIHPDFNGDFRRMGKRKYAHGGSRKKYHEQCETLAEKYLVGPADYSRLQFLYAKCKPLEKKCGALLLRTPRGINPVLIRKPDNEY